MKATKLIIFAVLLLSGANFINCQCSWESEAALMELPESQRKILITQVKEIELPKLESETVAQIYELLCPTNPPNYIAAYNLLKQLEKMKAPHIINVILLHSPILGLKLSQWRGNPLFLAVWNDAKTQEAKSDVVSYLMSNVRDFCNTHGPHECINLVADIASFLEQHKHELRRFVRETTDEALKKLEYDFGIAG